VTKYVRYKRIYSVKWSRIIILFHTLKVTTLTHQLIVTDTLPTEPVLPLEGG
jgi:hypothetical protein